LHVLNNITFSINKGESISILGPSGCGKSTLLRCISSAIHPDNGFIRIGGKSPQDAVKKKEIGFAFQEPALLAWRTVAENVRLPEEIGERTIPEDELDKRTQYVLSLTNLTPFAHFYPSELSGGLKQRVSLARALFTKPGLLLLDEPFASLDLLTRTLLAIELRRLVESTGIPAVLVTHSIEEAVIFARRVYILSQRPAEIRKITTIPSMPVDTNMLSEGIFQDIVSECRELLLNDWKISQV
jgi:NitT/TauT family transport system ATP-binding protein